MPKIARAMLWELWRLGRRRLISVTLGMMALCALFFHLVPPADSVESTSLLFGLVAMQLLFTVFLLLQCRDDAMPRAGFDARLFRLPVATWQLVTWRMVAMATAAAAVSLATVSFARFGYGADWPLLAPVAANVMAMAWAAAIFWALVAAPVLRVAAAWVTTLGLAWLVSSRYGPSDLRPDAAPAAVQALIVAGVLATAWGLAVWGVGRDRQGRPLRIALDRPLVRLTSTRSRGRAFSSPARAQWWFEWRQKGKFGPLHAAAALAMAVVLNSWDGIRTGPMLQMTFAMTAFMAFALPPILGALVGRFSTTSDTPQLDLFRATRPLGDQALATSFLGVGVLSLLATCAVAVAGLFSILLFLHRFGDRQLVEATWLRLVSGAEHLGPWQLALLALALALLAWTNMSFVACCFLTGRNAVVGTLVVAPYVLAVVVATVRDALPEGLLATALVAGAWAFGLLAPALTVAAFLEARRRNLVAAALPWKALGAYLLLVTVFASGLRLGSLLPETLPAPGLEQGLWLAALGVLALALAPVAAAPLAVAWNRHR